jgi:hypothetical protein
VALPDDNNLYKVAYDEAVRALSEQHAAIESFRGRAGLLLSAAAVTTSFLGSQALDGGISNPAAWLAMANFVGVAGTLLAVLWPHQWDFAASAQVVINSYIEREEPARVEELHRDLALYMYGSHFDNQDGLRQIAIFFQIASGLLAAEIVLWTIAIASSAHV